MKIYFKLIALLCLLCAAFQNDCIAQTTANTIKDTTITVKVSGITCGSDLPIIIKRVKQEKGIIECKAASKASATTTFEVQYDPAVITYDQIVAAIQDAPSCDYPNQKPYKVKNKK